MEQFSEDLKAAVDRALSSGADIADLVGIASKLADELDDRAARAVWGLTDAEMREQGRRCPCRGSDDMCPCQNVPFRGTIKARHD